MLKPFRLSQIVRALSQQRRLYQTKSPAATTTLKALDLWCLAEDDSKPFSIQAPLSLSAMKLKERIYEIRKHSIPRGVDATDLVLWKVCRLRIQPSATRLIS
jgi:hypothetical protein